MVWQRRHYLSAPCKAIALCVTLTVCHGCTKSDVASTLEQVSSATDLSSLSNDTTADELQKRLEQTFIIVGETTKMLRGTERFRYDRLKTQLNSGVALADRLIAHPTATDAQVGLAWNAKVRFLYQGAEQKWSGFTDRLSASARKLREDRPDDVVTELADALCIEQAYRRNNVGLTRVRQLLAAHAARYPNGKTGPNLYVAYSEVLRRGQRHYEASDVLREGAALFKDNPHAQRLTGNLASLKEANQKHASERHELAKELVPMRRKLGADRGVFILQAHEPNTANPQYQYEFKIVNGVEEAKKWVDKLAKDRWKRGWSWRVYRRFPPTNSGIAQARAELDVILKSPAMQR